MQGFCSLYVRLFGTGQPVGRRRLSLSTFCSLRRVSLICWLRRCSGGQVRFPRRLGRCGGAVRSLRGVCSLCSRRPAEAIEIVCKSLRVVSNHLHAAKNLLATLY